MVIVVLTLLGIQLADSHHSGYGQIGVSDWIVVLGLTGGLMFPAAFQSLFFRGEGQRLAHYLLILVASFVMLGIFTIMADAMNSTAFLWIFGWNPLAFIAMLEVYSSDRDVTLAGVIAVDLLLFTFLLVRAFMECRLGATVIQETRNSLETNP